MGINEGWLRWISNAIGRDGPEGEPPAPEPPAPPGFLPELGTSLWRLRRAIADDQTDPPESQLRRVRRHADAMWDILQQAGVSIQDHTGSPFNAGMSLKAVAFQPTATVAREEVLETVKPSIYFQGRHIQMGEVIVARPEAAAEPPAAEQPQAQQPGQGETQQGSERP